jgi:hypothetical protein
MNEDKFKLVKLVNYIQQFQEGIEKTAMTIQITFDVLLRDITILGLSDTRH